MRSPYYFELAFCLARVHDFQRQIARNPWNLEASLKKVASPLQGKQRSRFFVKIPIRPLLFFLSFFLSLSLSLSDEGLRVVAEAPTLNAWRNGRAALRRTIEFKSQPAGLSSDIGRPKKETIARR